MATVYITGMGIISALGIGVEKNHSALLNDKSGIKKATHLQSKYKNEKPFAEVDLSNQELKSFVQLPENETLSRTDMLAIAAFKEAISNANLSNEELTSSETAFITASTAGGMCHTDELFHDATQPNQESTLYANHYSAQAHSKNIARKFGLNGPISTFNTACSSSANAIMFGARLIKSGRVKRAIVGGVDSLGKFTVNGFNSLGILSNQACKSFDQNRDGLTLGEGAAYLVLESSEVVNSKNVLAKLSGYGNANDAFHASAISESAEGPIKSIEKALESAQISPEQISLINAHGTGTVNNDQTELHAIKTIFNTVPDFISTKPFTGHTLGAAGAIEAVISILSLVNNEIYSNLNFQNPMDDFNLKPNSSLIKSVNINHVLSNSFGFAGNCCSLIFSKS